MANTYNIAFEKSNLFAVVGEVVNFNILDGESRVTELTDDLSAIGANGSTFTIESNTEGDYDYKLTVATVATGTDIPDELTEVVTVKYNDEEFAGQGEGLTLDYLYKDVPAVNGYIGDVVTLSWTPGTVEVTNIGNEEVATASGAAITAVGQGTTTCDLVYTLGEDTKTVSGIYITVATPSVTDVSASGIDNNEATLVATATPADPTVMKFRYGLKDEFNPEDDTTYTEVEVDMAEGVGTYKVTGLVQDTEYACQAVIVYEENTYVSSITYFKTTELDSEMTLSESSITLLGVDTFTKTITASVEKVNDDSTINWTVLSADNVNVETNISDNVAELTIKYTGENEAISSNTLQSLINIKAVEVLDEAVLANTTGVVEVAIYPVVNKVTLYVDEANNSASTVIIESNSALEYSEYTPDENEGTYYTFDSENNSVTGVAKGEGSMTVKVTLEGDEDINEYEYSVAIEVLNAFEYPTREEILANVKVFNYKSEMLGNYPGKSLVIYDYKVSETVSVPFYLFRTNAPSEVNWTYDICALGSDIDKMTLAGLPEQASEDSDEIEG